MRKRVLVYGPGFVTDFMISQPISHLRQQFEKQYWVYLPGFIDQSQAAEWSNATKSLPGRRVWCGYDTITWSENKVPDQHALFRWVGSTSMTDFLRQITQLEASSLVCRKVWLNRYSEGEFIEPHKDRAGDCQLLVCLDSDPREGGVLTLNPDNSGPQSLALTPGDAVVFFATKVEHSTTPVTATGDRSEPQRITMAARYFSDGE